MRTQKYFMSVLAAVLLIVPLNLPAQEKEMPITTSSKEALQLFLAGRDIAENVENYAAIELFNKAVQKDPDFLMAYAYLAYEYQVTGQRESARKSIEKGLRAIDKVTEGEQHFLYMWQAFVEGNFPKRADYSEWKKHAFQLTTLYPFDKRAHLYMGEYYYFLTHEPENAIKYFKKAIELDDKYILAYNLLAYAYSSIGNYEEAEKALKTFIMLDPNSANPYDSYGDFLMKTRRYDEAIESFKTALEKNPEFIYSIRKAARGYYIKGDYDNARIMYKRFYDVARNSQGKMTTLYWLAQTYICENNMTEALKLYKEYQSIAEQDKKLSNYRIYAYANFGNIHTEMGDPIEGMRFYKKAIDLIDKVDLKKSEKETIIFNSIQWEANALIAQGELEQAKEILQKYEQQDAAKEDKAKEKTLNVVRARLAMAEGNDDDALELLASADASNPMTVYYQAVIYEKKGEKEKSSELYKKLEEWTDPSIDLAFVRNKMNNKL